MKAIDEDSSNPDWEFSSSLNEAAALSENRPGGGGRFSVAIRYVRLRQHDS
jgi:hypothetical protein